MPRYIDADALIKKIFPIGTGDGKYVINAGAVKFAIDNAPTADVVPKSEVERWRSQLEAVLEEIPETKRELVCEIFEEIEKAFIKYYDECVTYSSPILQYHTRQAAGFALNGMFTKFAELKKKYTEGTNHG